MKNNRPNILIDDDRHKFVIEVLKKKYPDVYEEINKEFRFDHILVSTGFICDELGVAKSLLSRTKPIPLRKTIGKAQYFLFSDVIDFASKTNRTPRVQWEQYLS